MVGVACAPGVVNVSITNVNKIGVTAAMNPLTIVILRVFVRCIFMPLFVHNARRSTHHNARQQR
jgi:hypothetical protein